MANKSRRQMADTIRTIIDLTKRQGRLTTEQVANEFGMSLDTARKYFRAAVATGEVIRYGRFGLFRDARATIDFDLVKYDYRKNAGACRMSKSFIVIIRRAWCNEGGHGIEYSSDLIHYETRNGAISHGFRAVDSDDFNVGVIEGGKLISFDWMDKPVGESEDTLAQIAELIGLEDAA